MHWELFLSSLPYLLVYGVASSPVIYRAAQGDVVAVGSYIREVRQPAPLRVAAEVEDLMSAGNAPKSRDAKKHMKNASGKSDEGGYYKTYGSDADGEKGYLKETYGKGDQGYKSLDTFHKQAADKYEFQEQTTYGKGHAGTKGEKREDAKGENGDHEGAGTMTDAEYAGDEDDRNDEGEYSRYTANEDGDDYSGAYTSKEPESTNYSSSDGDEESYEGHRSYSSDDGGEGAQDEAHY